VVVRRSERYFRPAEVETLLGDASKAATEARLDSRKRPSTDLVREMAKPT
jgi:GDP-D-mannose dehydratase